MSALYAAIPGAQLQTSGSLQGYYTYPCSTNVTVSLTFGGKAYSIKSVDFTRQVTDNECFGSFFGLDLGANTGVQWIVGDTFLKNVYSVYRQDPPAVGFATVKSGGSGTPSSSSGKSTATGTSTPKSSSGAAVRGAQVPIPGNGALSGLLVMGLAVLLGGALVL
jgi:hypothetical protein